MFHTIISVIISLTLIVGLIISVDVLLKWKKINFELLNVKAFLEENVLRSLWIKMFVGLSIFFVGYLIGLMINHFEFISELGGNSLISSELISLIALVLQAIGAFSLVRVLYDWSEIYKNAIED